MIDTAKMLGMPGYGANAVPVPNGTPVSLDSADDYAVYACANLAINQKLPDAGPDEIAFVEKNYLSLS